MKLLTLTGDPSCLFFFFFSFLSIRVFFQGHWQLTGQQGKWGDLFLFHSTTSTRSRTFRHLCAILHVRWLSHIFNHNACIYQTPTRWDLPPYRITIWLIDDERNRWTRTRIDYHPCITRVTFVHWWFIFAHWNFGSLKLYCLFIHFDYVQLLLMILLISVGVLFNLKT